MNEKKVRLAQADKDVLVLFTMIRQLVEEAPALKTLVADVHNDRDFLTPGATPARQLRAVLEGIGPELARHGLRPVSATMHEAVARFLRESRRDVETATGCQR